MGDNDYLLKIKRGANLKKVLARIVKEYKDVFLEKLENKSPKPKAQKGSQGGSGGPSASPGVPGSGRIKLVDRFGIEVFEPRKEVKY